MTDDEKLAYDNLQPRIKSYFQGCMADRDLVLKALEIAINAHDGQTRWDPNIPYVVHPMVVALRINDKLRWEFNTSEMAAVMCVALLHDVIEDTNTTAVYLRGFFPDTIVTAIEAISKDENLPYFLYIKALKNNNLARIVKVFDIEHNLESMGTKNHKNKRELYQLALLYLEDSK